MHEELLERQKLPKEARGHGIWKRRYREINDWERYLTDNGIKVVKLFLNLSKEEQRIRFLRRIDLPDHNWKFSSADVREREYWDDYQKAFSEMLSHTSTEWAPWHVIPADRKWYARIAAGAVIANALLEIDPRYPTVSEETARGPAGDQDDARGAGARGRRGRSVRGELGEDDGAGARAARDPAARTTARSDGDLDPGAERPRTAALVRARSADVATALEVDVDRAHRRRGRGAARRATARTRSRPRSRRRRCSGSSPSTRATCS